jgi:hypothetical protein
MFYNKNVGLGRAYGLIQTNSIEEKSPIGVINNHISYTSSQVSELNYQKILQKNQTIVFTKTTTLGLYKYSNLSQT